MGRIKLFGKNNKEVKNLLKLFQIPKNFDLSEEEDAEINSEMGQNLDKLQDNTNDLNVREMIISGYAAMALANLSREKLSQGDLKAAFSSCIKSLALFDLYENNWVLLAELLATHGALNAAIGALQYAQELHIKNGKEQPELLSDNNQNLWEAEIKRIVGIMEHKK